MRRGFTLRFLCLIATCAVLIVFLHFYLYIYKSSRERDNLKIYVDISPPGGFKKAESIMDTKQGQKSQSQKHGHGVVEAPLQSLSRPVETMGMNPGTKLKNKIVHLDLKGMPFKPEAYEKLFPFFTGLGVTGILMEYEDMFPYTDKLEPISNKQAYSPADIQRIMEVAAVNRLEVIPLIQTFGHMEFILKLEEFHKLREVPKYTQAICPTNNDSVVLIREMIDQVMALHPGIKYFHIGSDEVYHIGQCPLCLERMERYRLTEGQLFLQHVSSVAEYVSSKHNVQPLMWDDELRKLDEREIQQSGIGKLVEIVVWNYRDDVGNRLPLGLWEKYSRIFKSVWVGSAFKGANKPNSLMVNETMYLVNHYSWLQVMSDVGQVVDFKGIMITGWQRYDHFAVLCEILPSAIPSLTACMVLLNSQEIPPIEAVRMNASSKLRCGNFLSYCVFPGSEIHEEIMRLDMYTATVKALEEKHVVLGWAQEMNLRYLFTNPSHAEAVMQDVAPLKGELDRSRKALEKGLSKMYPQWSVDEWMMTNFQPLYDKVERYRVTITKILERHTFPRRPLDLDSSTTDSVFQHSS